MPHELHPVPQSGFVLAQPVYDLFAIHNYLQLNPLK
jgi:hypothetical protein